MDDNKFEEFKNHMTARASFPHNLSNMSSDLIFSLQSPPESIRRIDLKKIFEIIQKYHSKVFKGSYLLSHHLAQIIETVSKFFKISQRLKSFIVLRSHSKISKTFKIPESPKTF